MADVPAFPVADWERLACKEAVSLNNRRQECTPKLPWPAQPGFHSKSTSHIRFSDMELVKSEAVFKATTQITLILILCATYTKQGMTP